jgi:hypothetical protein
MRGSELLHGKKIPPKGEASGTPFIYLHSNHISQLGTSNINI